MQDRWEIGQVDKLIYATLANDTTIKTQMGITTGKARVSGYRVIRDHGSFPYIYFYCITGPDTPGQGTVRILSNPEYAIETRTIGAPTDASEAIVNRVDELICNMSRTLTPDGKWIVSARRRSPIVLAEAGEVSEVYYSRRGGLYEFWITSS